MRKNTSAAVARSKTHEGAVAARISPIQELRRTVLACMLWENTFYESGESIADRITKLVGSCDPHDVAALARQARSEFKLRHVPLLLVRAMSALSTHKFLVADTLEYVIQRPDELGEFLAIYYGAGDRRTTGQKLSKQVQRGLARAFNKFNQYSLAKYNRDNAAIKLRDVLFLAHPKPKDDQQAQDWKQLVDGTLPTPDTWEVELSASKDKQASWQRLLDEKKLGALALLRNLRNIQEAGIGLDSIRTALAECNPSRVLPFRFIAASRYAPRLESEIEQLMFKCVAEAERLPGKTALVVDHSGSMSILMSEKSDMTRLEAAAALAILIREVCDGCDVIAFGSTAQIVPARRGFALRDAMNSANVGHATNTDLAIALANQQGYNRIIVITDEQSHQVIRGPLEDSKAYFINVASYKNGIGYGRWLHIDGFSEAVLDFIRETEFAERVG